MKKLLAIFLAAAMCCTLLAACGGTSTESADEGAADETTEALVYAVETGSAGEAAALEQGWEINSVDTPLGKLSFNKSGDAAGLGLSVYVVKDGKFVETDHSITLH